MITPRTTRLVRVPDLARFRLAISWITEANREGGSDRLIVVPSRSAARQLLRQHPSLADVCAIVTRDELYANLEARLADPPRRLTPFERDALVQAAAAEAAGEVPDLGFQLRPGLIAEIIRFYDQLRRQSQGVTRFEELLTDSLAGGVSAGDRGAERLLQQTRFLARTFAGYEVRVRAAGASDEHGMRERLASQPAERPLRHVLVTVTDWIADPQGLFVADFDLLTRLPGLEAIDVLSTEALLRSGFHERIHQWLPGIDEVAFDGPDAAAPRPRLVIPRPAEDGTSEPWFTNRDRDEELVAIARRIKAGRRNGDHAPLDRIGIVFKKPLPYLYLAPDTLGAAAIPYQASDALPLAAEPSASALDLVLDAVESEFSRDSLIALLRSPHFVFGAGAWHQLDRALSKERYLGGIDRLEQFVDGSAGKPIHAAATLALLVARELRPMLEEAPASVQAERLRAFVGAHQRAIAEDDPFRDRELRARGAISDVLTSLSAAHAAHHDPFWTIQQTSASVRRWLGEATFARDTGSTGVQLLDDQAARYGEFAHLALVGLVEHEWPERPRRNIFYPSTLLSALGWPSEKDRRSAENARFVDLLTSATDIVTLSTFMLEDDALVSRSTQLDEVPAARLSTVTIADEGAPARVFAEEALALEPPRLDAVSPDTRTWADLRLHRTSPDDPQFHGWIGPPSPRAWSISSLELYLRCPFKFYAQHILRLPEEPEDEEIMDPRRQGQFVHAVFEEFFREWHGSGRRGITPATLPDARDLFSTIADRALESLTTAEAGLERTRLLGSPAAAGLGEAVFRMEAERPMPVVERLLEKALHGAFEIATSQGPRTLSLKGKADRIDLLDDGTFRLIDYKLGWPPDRSRALQLPIYSVCAEQLLRRETGQPWVVGEAVYLAFKGPRRVVPLFTESNRTEVLQQAQQRLSDTIDAIAQGMFPPRPEDVFFCDTCAMATVCRKDYA